MSVKIRFNKAGNSVGEGEVVELLSVQDGKYKLYDASVIIKKCRPSKIIEI